MYGECHAHIFMNGTDYRKAAAAYSEGVVREDVRQKLSHYQKLGISYIRDGGDHYGASVYARSIAGEYGIVYRTPVFAIHKNGHYGAIVGRGFDNMKEYHQLVLRVRKEKGDFIKVMFTGILDFGTDGSVTGTALKREEIREMIHIAHEEGFAVMAHTNGAGAVRDAVECGVDSVEHGNYMDEDCLQAFAESRAVWVPTLVTVRNLFHDGRFPDEVIRLVMETQDRTLRRAFELGIRVALGSDAGAYRVPHGEGLLDEYHSFCEILGGSEKLDRKLAEAEKEIEDRFRYPA